jgi:hypothetical protein
MARCRRTKGLTTGGRGSGGGRGGCGIVTPTTCGIVTPVYLSEKLSRADFPHQEWKRRKRIHNERELQRRKRPRSNDVIETALSNISDIIQGGDYVDNKNLEKRLKKLAKQCKKKRKDRETRSEDDEEGSSKKRSKKSV